MPYQAVRILCILLILPFLSLANCRAQSSNASVLTADWEKCKAVFLSEIDRSLSAIFKTLEKQEAIVRNEGDLGKVKAINEIRIAFMEKGELSSTIPRADYDQIRKQAFEQLATGRKTLVVKALQDKEDSIAELIDREFNELLNPLIADVHARWEASKLEYQKDCEAAKSLIFVQLDKLEENGRTAADPIAVEAAKKAKTEFQATGDVPPGVSRTPYEARLDKAKDRLKQVNKSLVRTLLLNKHDDNARSMAEKLSPAINHVAVSNEVRPQESNDTRKTWVNKSYNTIIYFRQGDAWDEINAAGKLERKVKELSRSNDYVEILLVDRQHLMRLYKDHADMFKDGRWQWIANGYWQFDN